jgi:hypothetical protein
VLWLRVRERYHACSVPYPRIHNGNEDGGRTRMAAGPVSHSDCDGE